MLACVVFIIPALVGCSCSAFIKIIIYNNFDMCFYHIAVTDYGMDWLVNKLATPVG